MAHRLKSKFDSRGRPGVESLWGQRSSGTKEAEESRGNLWGQRSSGTKKIGDREVWGQRRSGAKEAEESRGAFGDKEVWGQRRQGRALRASGDEEVRGQRNQGRAQGASGDKKVRGQRRKVEPPFQSCRHSRRHSRWQLTNEIVESVTN